MVEVEAHITGIVWKVECKVGDVVEEGDTVITLESMKMEMPVEAEEPGVVKEILVRRGSAGRRGRHPRRAGVALRSGSRLPERGRFRSEHARAARRTFPCGWRGR